MSCGITIPESVGWIHSFGVPLLRVIDTPDAPEKVENNQLDQTPIVMSLLLLLLLLLLSV